MLNELLKKYILDPDNEDHNYDLGMYYDSIGQTASALSYFLRCAERSNMPEIQYECLIRASSCFQKQGKRNFTVRGLLQHAISILPKRPEAYYLLSQFYELENKDGHWQDSYMIASIGEKVADFNCKPLKNSVNYPGSYAISFQKAVAAWWCGLCEESRNLFIELYKDKNIMDVNIKNAIENNMNTLNIQKHDNIYYHDSNLEEEHGIITTNQFHINKQQDNRFFVVDNFYEDPDAVRDFAIKQTYYPGEGAVGHRTRKQFLFQGIKERFEQTIRATIPKHTDDGYGWEDIGINGRFQYCPAGTNLVYHCDSQKWAAIVYLTPDAPVCGGTSFYRHKQTKKHHNSQIDWNNGEGNIIFNQHTFLDRTPYELVDTVGNIYNRLVIFDGGLIHSAAEYFGWNINNSRLFHIFFFNSN
jgi:tetratricopeptide (TPR) repeat protein